jgi:hypothetical protein
MSNGLSCWKGSIMRKIVATFGAMLVTASMAHAQSTAWGDNGYVSFAGMYRTTKSTFGDSLDVTINQETSTLQTAQSIDAGPAYDITAGGRIIGHLGVGFGFTYLRQDTGAAVQGGIPHPFFFGQPRTLSGTATGLRHEERAIHVHAMWLMPMSESFQMAVFGGPTYFQVRQAMVSNVAFDDSYPYDTVTFSSVSTTRQKATRVGYNAGVDVSYFFAKYLGVGGLVRYSRGEVRLPSPDGGRTTVEVGGLQSGAGLRFRF